MKRKINKDFKKRISLFVRILKELSVYNEYFVSRYEYFGRNKPFNLKMFNTRYPSAIVCCSFPWGIRGSSKIWGTIYKNLFSYSWEQIEDLLKKVEIDLWKSLMEKNQKN